MSKKIIAVSGARGFIGAHLSRELSNAGYDVWPLVRTKNHKPHEIFYDYDLGEIERDKLAHCYAVIHLAGKNIMSGGWSEKNRREIFDSRVKSAGFLARILASMPDGPRVFLCSSAVGIYGDRGDTKLDENSQVGAGFLSNLCQAWEEACKPAQDSGVRVVNLRTGVVLDKCGGLLKNILPIFKLGLGFVIGSGDQYWPLIHMSDWCRAVCYVLAHDQISGPVNLVGPKPVTNREFTKILGRELRRPTCLRIPASILKLILGEQSSLMLGSSRVYPQVLLDAGFEFELSMKHNARVT